MARKREPPGAVPAAEATTPRSTHIRNGDTAIPEQSAAPSATATSEDADTSGSATAETGAVRAMASGETTRGGSDPRRIERPPPAEVLLVFV